MTEDEIDALSDDALGALHAQFHDAHDFMTMVTKFLFGDDDGNEVLVRR